MDTKNRRGSTERLRRISAIGGPQFTAVDLTMPAEDLPDLDVAVIKGGRDLIIIDVLISTSM